MADYRGNVVSTILPLSLQSAESSDLLCNILPALSEHGIFSLKKADALQSVVAEINNCLNSSKKRLHGLLLLEAVLCQCSAEVFSSSCQTWMQLLLQALQTHGSSAQHQCTLQVLAMMIERVTMFPELARDVGTTRIKVLLPAVLSLTSKCTREAAVSCIIACILHFPGPTGAFKSKIEALVTEELHNVSPSQVYIRCSALLARCTTGGHRGEKHREAWMAQYDKLMSTLNSLLSQLYLGFESGEEEGSNSIFTCALPNTQPERSMCLVRRFSTLSACLAALLREPFPTWIQLPLEEILRFVGRTLAVQMDMLVNKVTTDHLLLLTTLPSLHSAALAVLQELIVCAKGLLCADAELINRLCVQCLASTHLEKAAVTSHRPFRKLREKVYETLEVWLQVTGSLCGCSNNVSTLNDLLAEVYFDISQQQPQALQLDSSSRNSSAPPAKKKKKGKKSNYQELCIGADSWRILDNKDTAAAALKVLHLLIVNTHTTMPSITFSGLQARLSGLVMEVQQTPLAPYSSPQCRQLLYQVLLACVCVPCPDPLLLQQAIHLFQRGTLDTDVVVVVMCRQALDRCQSLIHPITPCLLAPVVKPAHVPSLAAPTSTISDDTITTTTATINNNLITTSTDSTVGTVTHLPAAQFHTASTLHQSSPKSSPRSSVSSTLPEESQLPHASSVLDSSGDTGPGSSSPSATQQRADTLVPAAPSTSGSCELSGNLSSAKRKRGQSDCDDDSDDEEEESWEKQNKSEEVVPSQARKEEAMDAGGDGDEGKTAGRKGDMGNVGDGEDRGRSDGDGQEDGLSAMLMSFVPCEADSSEDISD